MYSEEKKEILWKQENHTRYEYTRLVLLSLFMSSNESHHEKTCLWVCDQVRLKPACSATEASLEILDIASIDFILSKK